MEAEAGYVLEAFIGCEKWSADVDGGSCDPQVIGVDWFVQRMSYLSA